MGRGLAVMGVPLMGGGPKNTVAPAIAAAAVIGTQITPTPGTWTGSPVLTYQWQRYTSGAWADIAGATTANRTPVDADFGLALRLAEIPNGNAALAAYSNQTNLVIEAPAQTLGPTELVVNGTFAAWTGDNPNGWSVTETAPSLITESAGACRFARSTADIVQCFQYIMVPWAWHNSRVNVTNVTSGTISELWGAAAMRTLSATGTQRLIRQNLATNTAIFRAAVNPTDVTLDDVSIMAYTTNGQLTAPSANMALDCLYTLSGSPGTGSHVLLLPRISNMAAANYWADEIWYTGAQWNVALYSVAAGVFTSRISAANVGATNGIRINMNGDSISLYTTADTFATVTQRGSTISNSTYNTATGVNVLWASDVTPGNLVYAAAS